VSWHSSCLTLRCLWNETNCALYWQRMMPCLCMCANLELFSLYIWGVADEKDVDCEKLFFFCWLWGELWNCQNSTSVFFNRGSAEPKGSASVYQGFRSWPVTNNLACKITPDNIVVILSVDFFLFEIAFLCVFLYRLTVLDHFCCQ